MVQGNGTGRTARRARRLGRWWGAGATSAATDVPQARPEADADDGWFHDWLHRTADDSPGTGHALALTAASGWVTLTGLNRPGSTRGTVEHVAVGPGGIVVVETLPWDGEISVLGGTLRHRGYGRTPDVAEVAGAAGALTALLAPGHRRAVQAVVCLGGRDLDPVAVCGGAVAVGEHQLAAYLTALPERLAAADVPLVVDYLVAELGGATSPELLTVDDVFRPVNVWDAPAPTSPVSPAAALAPTQDAPSADAAPAPADAEPSSQVDGYHPPPNVLPDGHPDQSPDAPEAARPDPAAAARPAFGDGMLRVGLLVLGLLTVGNVLLAWLDLAG
ncbi:nuclease-related domain-containing protein [Cellulomonas triticagri]|uniref:NERD domain-containing protein n=1 Tax=Cellulomonas triticagri TaxID=2483352 RepID=A0A3M2JT34_9CELL|nr:nuclease-related domain-containing protein [Cellulomonas triticagri]RMI13905.1 hypothetical protein EBM89_02735 [Cellulomonas triticagri]